MKGLPFINHPTGGFLYSGTKAWVHSMSHSLPIAPASKAFGRNPPGFYSGGGVGDVLPKSEDVLRTRKLHFWNGTAGRYIKGLRNPWAPIERRKVNNGKTRKSGQQQQQQSDPQEPEKEEKPARITLIHPLKIMDALKTTFGDTWARYELCS